MGFGTGDGEDVSALRVVPFAIALVVAMALAAGVLMLARWLSGDLVAEPGVLGKLGQSVAGSEGPGSVEHIELRNVLSATVVGGLLGWGIASGALRWLSRPRSGFTAAAVIGFIGWGLIALTHAETVTTAVWLNAIHVAAAVPIIGGLARQLPAAIDNRAHGGADTGPSDASTADPTPG